MRNTNRRFFVLAAAVGFSLVMTSLLEAKSNRIDVQRGKQYRMSKKHGPWMIMVASFNRPADASKGMSPREAADELVYELRKQGLPAYTFVRKADVDSSPRRARRSNQGTPQVRRGKYRLRDERYAVLAGNYPSSKDRKAQRTLAWVKSFHPKFLRNVEKDGKFIKKLKNGGVYRNTPGRPKPLSGAHMTINPKLSWSEVREKKDSPLLLKLNSGMKNSLMKNRGNYTLRIASFYGKSVTLNSGSKFSSAEKKFKIGDSLDKAATGAWELAEAMRQRHKIETYVWHDQHKSVVTVGSFKSPNDPLIPEVIKVYKAKIKEVPPKSGRKILVAETFTIPARIKPGVIPVRHWMFDPTPRLIKVPKL